jgi:hypothetical protein
MAVRLLIDAGQDPRLTIRPDGPGRDRVLFTIADLDLAASIVVAVDGARPARALPIVVLPALSPVSWPALAAALGSGARGVVGTRPGWAPPPGAGRLELVNPRDPMAIADAVLRQYELA